MLYSKASYYRKYAPALRQGEVDCETPGRARQETTQARLWRAVGESLTVVSLTVVSRAVVMMTRNVREKFASGKIKEIRDAAPLRWDLTILCSWSR